MEKTRIEYFTSINNIIGLMKNELGEKMSPLRLQKTLYFLYAYYGASYGSLSESAEFQVNEDEKMNLPKYLFQGNFEAWQYGPVVREVYIDNKYNNFVENCEFKSEDINIEDTTMSDEVTEYLRELIQNTNEVSDFSLVERSHEDKEWKDKIATQGTMCNDKIIDEYKEIVNG